MFNRLINCFLKSNDNGYIILSAGADTFAFVGLQLVGFHEMGSRESIRGRKRSEESIVVKKYNQLCKYRL